MDKTMKSIRETNWKYRYMAEPINRPYDYPRITLIRYAITPKGKGSKYYTTICKYGKDRNNLSNNQLTELANEMYLPKLPKGYSWSEPFIM